MVRRRGIIIGVLASPVGLFPLRAKAQPNEPVVGQDVGFEQLALPPVDSLDDPELFGYRAATAAQIAKVDKILDETPKGPRPIDIAKSFVDRFAKPDPEAISQWPVPSSWNPLIKEFFSATSLRANNDMIDWCAAFVNWCIVRNNRQGTNSAASQSFINAGMFSKTDSPQQGDLVVFTCYDKKSGKTLGLGHVAFYEERVDDNRIRVIGGNQSSDGHSSIISERDYITAPFDVRRRVGDEYVLCTFRLNSYLSLT